MKYIISSLVLALAILAHAVITKPIPPGVQIRHSKGDFANATREIVTQTAAAAGNQKKLKGVDVDEVRFSHDGTTVLVEYTIRMDSQTTSSGLVFQGDTFGRYSARGSFEGREFSTMIK